MASNRLDGSTGRPGGATTRTTLQKGALATGAVFLLVGLLGFIPGITSMGSIAATTPVSGAGGLTFAGRQSDALLLGLFQVSILHNLVHLLYGVAGILAARTWSASRAYLIGGGAVYLVLWIYGLLIDKNSGANFVPLNRADDWLHFGLGVGMIALGYLLSRRRTADTGVRGTA